MSEPSVTVEVSTNQPIIQMLADAASSPELVGGIVAGMLLTHIAKLILAAISKPLTNNQEGWQAVSGVLALVIGAFSGWVSVHVGQLLGQQITMALVPLVSVGTPLTWLAIVKLGPKKFAEVFLTPTDKKHMKNE